MTSTPPTYQTMVSPRSRRLRTVGMVLLAAAVTMALYGCFVLMPRLRSSVVSQVGVASAAPDTGIVVFRNRAEADHFSVVNRRAHRVATLKVLFAYGYWTVCGLLVVGMLLVAWMDTREVSRNYLNERRSVWLEAARTMSHDKEE